MGPELRCDILVVGNGRAAAAAAVAASEGGAAVILLRETPLPGLPATVRLAVGHAWGAFAPDEVAALIDGAACVVRPRRLILAPLPTPIPEPIPGWGLARVVGLDGLHQVHGRVVLAGSGTGLLYAARIVRERGHTVVAVLPIARADGPGDRLRAMRLRRAGIPVLTGAALLRCEGDPAFQSLLLADGHRIAADWCVLHGGFTPEAGLARALGVPCRVIAPGVLLPLAERDGATAIPGVFVLAGDAPKAAGRRTGHAAAGLRTTPPRRTPAPETPATRPDVARFSQDDIVCPCEAVPAGAVRRALAEGAASVPAIKRATRAGMGRCQARRCGPTLHAFCPAADGNEHDHIAPRAPLLPLRAGLLAQPAEADVQLLPAPPASRWTTRTPAPPPPASADALVIGGGVVGLCAALHLAEAGRDVIVLDRAQPGLAASTANAGSLHVQLLPEAFRDSDPGPLGEALALGPASIALWRGIAAAAGETLGIRTEGGLVLAADAADMDWLARKVAFERARGIDTRILGPGELASLVPALARTYAGAAFCAEEGQIDPLRGTMALLRLARAAGIRILPHTAADALEPEGPAWHVRTGGHAIRAHQVLNAAGAHAGSVAALAGVPLPIRAVVQQVIATAPAPALLRHLVAQAGTRLSLKQTDAGHLLVGGGWPGRLDPDGATRLHRRSIEGSLWTAIRALPGLAEVDVVRAWTGLAVHLDRGPVISATPGRPGLFHAVTSNGYTLGPVAGRIAAEAMLGRAAPRAFALDGA